MKKTYCITYISFCSTIEQNLIITKYYLNLFFIVTSLFVFIKYIN